VSRVPEGGTAEKGGAPSVSRWCAGRPRVRSRSPPRRGPRRASPKSACTPSVRPEGDAVLHHRGARRLVHRGHLVLSSDPGIPDLDVVRMEMHCFTHYMGRLADPKRRVSVRADPGESSLPRAVGLPFPPPAGRLPIPASSEHARHPARAVHRYGLPLLRPRFHVGGPPDRRRSKPGDRLGEVLAPRPSVCLRARGVQHRRHLGESYEVSRLPSHV
jgi:hypothetical protein